jgi:type I restriction enzyme M protein
MAKPKEYLGIDKDRLEEGGHVKIVENSIVYVQSGKRYKITDPEERVRANFYLELINKYKYPKERIDLEVSVKGEKRPAADIVVYEDNEMKKPYIVVECKKDGISQAEIKQAIEEGIPNSHYLKAKYAIIVAGNVRIAFDIANFPPQEREKNVIADIPVRYGKVIKYVYKKGGPQNKDDPSKELKEVTRDELLAKFQQCHDTLWEGGRRNPAEAFDEMSKLMYCKIQDERFLTQKGEYYRFQVGTYETINEVGERIKRIYKDAQDIDPEVFVESVKVDSPVIYTVAEILQGISLARTDLDVKGEGYEHFLGGVFRGAMGQYFTPRPIVAFMVSFLEPNINDFVIDPACGSGGFLIYTLEKIRKELFAKLEKEDAADRWKDFALKQVYGIEINSQLARVSMMNMIIHEDGHTNIENADALDNPERWKRQKIREYFSKKFTLLLTNPPFGADVKEREKPYLASYELGGKVKKRNRQNTEILFIERCLDFLKPGGRIGIVLPDGILTNSTLQYVRDFITEKAQILGVVSLPQTAFKRPSSKGSGDTGSGVKASLLFLRKKKEGEKLSENYPIFMSVADHIGYDATGRLDKDEFPDILKAWQKFRNSNKIDFFVNAPLCFAIGRGEIEGRFDSLYYRPSLQKEKKYRELKLLKDISIINPKREVPLAFKEHNIVPYLGLPETNETTGEVVKITQRLYSEVKSRNIIQNGDILFARIEPSVYNKKTIFVQGIKERFAFTSTEFHIVQARETTNQKFLFYMFRENEFVYQQVFGKVIGTTGRRRIDSRAFGSFLIPFPPRPIQDKIANMMDEAYHLKREKEAKAEKLLDSIDDYVLKELGIKLPTIKEEKSFSVTFDKIKGKRFDPFHYLDFNIIKAINKGKYPGRKLMGTSKLIESGQRPKGGVRHIKEGVISIGGEHINRDGEFDLSEPKYVPENFFKKLTKGKISPNDILVVKDGATTGKTAIVTEGFPYKDACINEHVFRIVAKDNIDPTYLFTILFSSIGQRQINRVISGAAQKGIVLETISEILVPIPPVPIQQKIAEEVESRREKAKILRQEAKEIIQQAGEKVEKMILVGTS